MSRYAVVTGCSKSSIGFLAAKTLAAQPHNFKVILGCRDEEKGKEAEEAILAEHPESKAIFMKLDLASFASIREFVTKLREMDNGVIAEQGLDLLVNNAGVAWGAKTLRTTEDGLEEIVGVNHFGHFLLTNLLLEDLKRAEKARVVVLGSSLHDPNAQKKEGQEDQTLLPSFPEGILQKEENYDGMKAYGVSKLCNIWFAYELQRRLGDSTSVVVNVISPGFIPATGLGRHATGILGRLVIDFVVEPLRYFGLLPSFVRSQDDGAKAIVEAAVGNIASKGGQYLCLPQGKEELEPLKSSIESYSEDKAKELWELSVKTCKL
jgi:NAD(P)-dependent dehydrogenase (short-subunit alcohol dehydrogenase family)